MTSRHHNSEPLALTVAAAATTLSISTRHLYHLINTQQVRAVRLGRRLVIPTSELRRLLEEQ